MNTQFTIATSGTDPVETLKVTITEQQTVTVFEASVQELQARIAAYDTEIAAILERKAADQALLDSILGEFTKAGVVDLKSPLTVEQATAITNPVAEAIIP